MGILRDRLGLLHPDGSLTVLPPHADMAWARREALGLDENQVDPTKFTRIVQARVELVDEIETPSDVPIARVARRESCRR